jgi:hypothetical protein
MLAKTVSLRIEKNFQAKSDTLARRYSLCWVSRLRLWTARSIINKKTFSVLFVVFFCPNASCDVKEEGEEERKKNEEVKDERTEEKEVKGKKRGLFKTMGEAKALSKYSYTLFFCFYFLLYLSGTKEAFQCVIINLRKFHFTSFIQCTELFLYFPTKEINYIKKIREKSMFGEKKFTSQ